MLKDKIVFISGASEGIGKACAEDFAKMGANLILTARSFNKLEIIKDELEQDWDVKIHILKLDVQDKLEVQKVIGELDDYWKNIDILINNAGLAREMDPMQEGNIDDWDVMIDTNVKGLLYLTRNILPLMKGEKGHIINIGSTAGIHAYPGGTVYCATKSAVKFISDGLRQDLVATDIRVTNIQPGMVETNFSLVRFGGNKDKADNVYKGIKALTAYDISNIAVYTASLPSHVQICEVTVTPTHQATGGVVHKNI